MESNKELRFSLNFAVPPKVLYEALTISNLMSSYTRCLAKIKPEEGSDFELYDG